MDKNRKNNNFEIRFFRGVVQRNPDYVDALVPLAEAYTKGGYYEEGLEVDKRLSLLCRKDPTIRYNLACSFALVGNKAEAIKTLKMAIKLGYSDFNHMKKDEDLQSLSEEPEFLEILNQVGQDA